MPRKFQEGDVLFADAVQDAHRAVLLVAEPDDLSARCAEHGSQRGCRFDGRAEVLFEKLLEDVCQYDIQRYLCERRRSGYALASLIPSIKTRTLAGFWPASDVLVRLFLCCSNSP
jgi:hypothetical protein